METNDYLTLIKLLRDELKEKQRIIHKLEADLIKTREKIKRTKKILKESKKHVKKAIFSHKLKKKSFFDLNDRARQIYSKKIKSFFSSIEMTLKKADLSLNKVVLNRHNEENKGFSLIIQKQSTLKSLYTFIYFKDKFYLSDRSYNAMIQTLHLDNFFTLQQIVSYRWKLNEVYRLLIIELDKDCLMINFQLIMKIRVEFLFKDFKSTDKIKIKLSTDGTQVGNKQQFINFTCTFPDLGDNAKSVNGNFTLGLCQNRENYENYAKAFNYLNKEISEFKSIKINGSDIQIHYSFVGDVPVLRYVLGLNGVNSTYPCSFCKVNKKELHIIDYNYSIFDRKYKRTYDEQNEIITKKSLINYGYVNKPLLSSIPYENFCMDTLHLELNISKYLCSLFEEELISMDNIKSNAVIDFTKHIHLAKYFKFLNETCNLNLVPILSDKKGKTKIYRTLRCWEYERIFKRINIPKLFPEISNSLDIQRIWNDFQLILSNIKRNKLNNEQMKKLICNWFINFSRTFNAIDSSSIYFHKLVHHTHEFMQIHQNIHNLNMQGKCFIYIQLLIIYVRHCDI